MWRWFFRIEFPGFRIEFYFYMREPILGPSHFFMERPYKDINELPLGYRLYLGFVDWGDGSPVEYDDEPFRVTDSSVMTHTYEKSGFYEINGEIFNVGFKNQTVNELASDVRKIVGDDIKIINLKSNDNS